MASLRAAGHFLEKLELKSLDNPASDEASHVVNRVFIRYSNLITRTLSFGRALAIVSCIYSLAPAPNADAIPPQLSDDELSEAPLTSPVRMLLPFHVICLNLPRAFPSAHSHNVKQKFASSSWKRSPA
jgi:hypothetical protein